MENTWIYGKNKQYSTIFKENVKNSIPVISGITINNGVNYYTTDTLKDNEVFSDCLTISTRGEYSGTVTYHKGKFALANNILAMPLNNKWSEKSKLFIATLINSLRYGGYSGYPRKETLKNDIIKLPITASGEIDFEFMESFISELEAERVAELEAYLAAASLKDYELTADELSALSKFENYNWGEFRIGDLFIRLNTKKLPYKAKDLPVNVQDKFNLPCLTSSFNNQGLNYFAPRDGATILKNVISLPSNSDVYRGYFQSRDFTVLSDAYVIDWINKETKHKIQSYLFSLTSINKVTDLPIYSYKNKLGGWNVVRNKLIQLPINKDGDIDFEFMNNFIKAIEKLVIKDVVLYTDNKIKATKSIVSSNQ